MIGLGRMGGNMARRLHDRGFDVAGFDVDPEQTCNVAANLRWSAGSIPELVEVLKPRRVIWVMVPAGEPTGDVIDQLSALLSPEDIIIDGGDSCYKDSMSRATDLAKKNIPFLDVGVGGGLWGLADGYCLMVGGEKSAYTEALPVLSALSSENGCALLGTSGAGHYARAVQNGIECAMLQAYGEGMELLDGAPFGYNAHQLASLWGNGSEVRSWMLDLCARVLANDSKLRWLKGWIGDAGEGRLAVSEAVDKGVSVPGMATALFARYRSWKPDAFSAKLIAAVRRELGGHDVLEAFAEDSDSFATEKEAA